MKQLVLVALVVIAACAPLEDPSPAPTKRDARPAQPFVPPPGFERLRFGLVPFLSAETMAAGHDRLAGYLSKVLSVPVEVQIGASYADSIDRLERGQFDLVELSPYAYALASKRVKLKCVAQEIADGSMTGSAYLFVRDDSPRRSLADLQGASLALVDPFSTSGNLYPKKLLKQAGVTPSKVEFLGNHEAVLLAVKEGRFEAGATYQGGFEALRRSRGVDPLTFRVIAKSPRTPRDVVCARSDLPEPVIDAIAQALLSLSTRDRLGREVLGPLNLNGFGVAVDHAYDDVRRVAEEFKGEAP